MNPFIGRRSSWLPRTGFRLFLRGGTRLFSASLEESGDVDFGMSLIDLSRDELLLLQLLELCFICSDIDFSSLASLGWVVDKFLWGYGKFDCWDDFAE